MKEIYFAAKAESMKYIALFAVSLLLVSSDASAQKLFFLFGHAGYASPVGKLRNSNNAGLALEAGAGVGMNKTFITGTIGHTWLFVNKNGTVSEGGLRYTPYRLGIRRYLLLKNLFVKAEGGLATVKIIDTDNKSSKFTSSFGAGVKFTRFEALVDYNSVGTYGSWFGIKFGMNIGL